MDIIIDYFKKALAALLSLFGIVLDTEFSDNVESMVGGLGSYEPENEAGTIDM